MLKIRKAVLFSDNTAFLNFKTSSGERGIRTPGGITLNGFQDRRNRPLCHLSGGKSTKKMFSAKKKINL
jgi:site-specific DNA recombinase